MDDSPITEISCESLNDLNIPSSASIQDVEHLASYNWICAPRENPTIAVPGVPSIWAPPSKPYMLRVSKDVGHVFINQNAARLPDSPLEPLFRALYVANPAFNIAEVDVVTDRNVLRKLLGFVNPRHNEYKRDFFAINVEFVKKTVIFSRKEAKNEDWILPDEFKGYGHKFERLVTVPEIKNSSGHHRILSYRLSDLNFLVRHETDAYILGIEGAGMEPFSDVYANINTSTISSTPFDLPLSVPPVTRPLTNLTVLEQGFVVAISSTLEIKTRSVNRPFPFEDVAPQLYFSQTPNLVRAKHDKGRFDIPQVEEVADLLKLWEEENEEDLRKLTALIGEVRRLVKGVGGKATLKYCVESDQLQVYTLGEEALLPNDLYDRWGGIEGMGERDEGDEPTEDIAGGCWRCV